MRLVIVVLVLLTMYLQYGLWYTRGGKHDVEKLKTSVAEQKDEIARLKERNRSLSAEVMDLKQGLEAIEERARSEMGMIKNGEVFFRITDPNHEHDQPQNVSGLGKGLEAPLEPPLDPLASGDGSLADSPDVPPAAQDKAASARPMVKAIVGAAVAKSAASAKGSAATPAKAAGTAGKPSTPSAGKSTSSSTPKTAPTAAGKATATKAPVAKPASKPPGTSSTTTGSKTPTSATRPKAVSPSSAGATTKPVSPSTTVRKTVPKTTSGAATNGANGAPKKTAPVE